MAARMSSLRGLQIAIGDLIELTTFDDEDEERTTYEGTVFTMDGVCLGLKNCRNKDAGGKMEAGIQTFSDDEIVDVKVLSSRIAPKSSKNTDSPNTRNKLEEFVPPKPRSLVRPKEENRENPRLKKFDSLNMKDILSQKQVHDLPPCVTLNLKEGEPKMLFKPSQDSLHMEGSDFNQRQLAFFDTIRKHFWDGPDEYPALRYCPSMYYFINSEKKSLLPEIFRDLFAQAKIALSVEGQVCHEGELSLISIATAKTIYIFDFLEVGSDLVDAGLKDLLEDARIMKVLHDSRKSAYLLLHHCDIKLCGVYDTLATHCVFMAWAHYGGFMQQYTDSWQTLARAYLGISTKHLFTEFYRQNQLAEDLAIWLERPLREDMELGAAMKVMYLLDLRWATSECYLLPQRMATLALLDGLRYENETAASFRNAESHLLPIELKNSLPDWRLTEENVKKASRAGIIDDEFQFVHNFVGQINPTIIYSKDCLHQMKK